VNVSSYLAAEHALSSATNGSDTSNYTYAYQAADTNSLCEAGTYANGSYSFASFALNHQYSTTEDYQETGSSAGFTSYAREDKDIYSYVMQQTSSGSAANYTLSATETVSTTFNGTLSGGGTLADALSVIRAYIKSGTYDVSSGVTMDANPEASRPARVAVAALLGGGDLSAPVGPSLTEWIIRASVRSIPCSQCRASNRG